MLSDDATVTELRDTAENFTWVFDYVKTNAEQLRALDRRKPLKRLDRNF